MTLGDRIRQRREELRLSQQELAEKTGMLQTLISRLERGANKNPGAEVLKRLARVLGVSIDYLVGLYDDKSTIQMVGTTS